MLLTNEPDWGHPSAGRRPGQPMCSGGKKSPLQSMLSFSFSSQPMVRQSPPCVTPWNPTFHSYTCISGLTALKTTFWKGLLLSSFWRTDNSDKATRSCWPRGGSTQIARRNIFFLRFPYLLCAPGSIHAKQIGFVGWHMVDDCALKKSLPLTQQLCLLRGVGNNS